MATSVACRCDQVSHFHSTLSINGISIYISIVYTRICDTQKLAHIDQRERDRSEQREREASQSSNQGKSEDIVLLEKQGRCSQKLRNNVTGNLAQVTQTVGQNMTDISNIGGRANTTSKVRHLFSFYPYSTLTPFE